MTDPFEQLLRDCLPPGGPSLPRRPSRIAMLIDEVYPDATSMTLDGRLSHADIPLLADEEIDRERVLATLRWALTHRPTPWLIARRARLDQEADRRRKGQR